MTAKDIASVAAAALGVFLLFRRWLVQRARRLVERRRRRSQVAAAPRANAALRRHGASVEHLRHG